MVFTDQIYQLARPLWLKSIHHPFIKQLVSGQLSLSQFRFYLLQDRYYLSEFGKLHYLIADKLTDKKAIDFLLSGAKGLKNGEIEERKVFFDKLHITSQEIKLTPISPTAYNYVNHMYAALYRGSVQQGIAALLPCYWLYNEIGKNLVKKSSPVSFYSQWLNTYASSTFTSSTQQIINLTNQVADKASQNIKQKMSQDFIRSSYFELHYWDMPFTKESWD